MLNKELLLIHENSPQPVTFVIKKADRMSETDRVMVTIKYGKLDAYPLLIKSGWGPEELDFPYLADYAIISEVKGGWGTILTIKTNATVESEGTQHHLSGIEPGELITITMT